MHDPDSFFYAPAGYTDADMEMAELTAAGNRFARLVKLYGEDNARRLMAGETITAKCVRRGTTISYEALVRLDLDARIYSVNAGATWHDSAREAYDAAKGDTAP